MFFSHSFLPLHFLGSDLHCCLSEQLVGLLCDPGSTLPHTLLVGWASSGFLRWGHSPAQKPLRLHYFPENEIGKHKVQVIFTDLCVTVFLHVVCMPLARPYFSLLLPFLLGLEWHQTGLCLPHVLLLCSPKRLPSSLRPLELLSPLTPQRLCTSHPQRIPILVVIYSFTLSNFSLPETITLRL